MVDPLKRPHSLAIAIPASLTFDVPHLREKTFRIGQIGRAAAIFRVDEIIIYPDVPNVDQKPDTTLIQTILSYIETPQYLRKRLFKILPELQYAGTLPPLRTPHHPTASKISNLRIGEYREGVVLSNASEGSLVDIGVEQPVLVSRTNLKINSRVTVKITKVEKRPEAELADRTQIKTYWGYRTTVSDVAFGQMLKRRQFNLVIATSKKGKPITLVLDVLREKWKSSQKTVIAFGAPTQGLIEIAAREKTRLDEVADFVVNAIPNQATETVRTEEAVYATLSILNILDEKLNYDVRKSTQGVD
jgi:hypothetical protein